MKIKNDFLYMERVIRVLFYILDDLKEMSDEIERPINWLIMHTVSSCQLAKLYALKEGLDPELAALTAIFHDVGIIYSKKIKDHDKKAEPFVRQIISEFNTNFGKDLSPITENYENKIVTAIIDHSNKSENSSDPLSELLKNIDSLERYLNGLQPKTHQIKRAKNSLSRLGVIL